MEYVAIILMASANGQSFKPSEKMDSLQSGNDRNS